MRSFPVSLSRRLGVLLTVALTPMVYGQQAQVAKQAQPKPPAVKPVADETTPPGSVHRMEIYQGPNRSVHYIPSGDVPTSDRLAAYELERTENEMIYAHDLQRLKQQYVNSERMMEPQRLYVQEQLYGASISYGRSFAGFGGFGGFGGGTTPTSSAATAIRISAAVSAAPTRCR
jgi:hypothetical protein